MKILNHFSHLVISSEFVVSLCRRIQEIGQMASNLLARLVHLLPFLILHIIEPQRPFVWMET